MGLADVMSKKGSGVEAGLWRRPSSLCAGKIPGYRAEPWTSEGPGTSTRTDRGVVFSQRDFYIFTA